MSHRAGNSQFANLCPKKHPPSMPVTKHRFTVDDYYRMGDAGVFPPERRVELLEGEILINSVKTPGSTFEIRLPAYRES